MPNIPRERNNTLAGKGDEIERRFLNGEKTPAIAASYGVTKQAIQQLLGRRGVTAKDCRLMMDTRVKELTSQGKTVSAIASDVGRTPQTVRRTLHRLGIEPVSPQPRLRPLPEETTSAILRLRAEGATIGEIAELVGLAASTVSNHLIRNGRRTQNHRSKGNRLVS